MYWLTPVHTYWLTQITTTSLLRFTLTALLIFKYMGQLKPNRVRKKAKAINKYLGLHGE